MLHRAVASLGLKGLRPQRNTLWRRNTALQIRHYRIETQHAQFYALVEECNRVREQVKGGKLNCNLPQMNPRDVFVAKELDLRRLTAVGFDYDYTLAKYKPDLQKLIYDMAAISLVSDKHYPAELLAEWPYDPNFAIRGLFYDARHGLLLKVDSYRNIQPGTVYKGRTPVPIEQVKEIYGGMQLWKPYLKQHMYLLSDIFSLPEVCLLANVVQLFMDREIPFDSRYLYRDVKDTISELHRSGQLHRAIVQHIDQYLVGQDQGIEELLLTLRHTGKSTFLLSNSPYWFIDRGMSHIIGKDWRELFNIVIASAQKPAFYGSDSPFRMLDTERNLPKWRSVDSFRRRQVYVEGNLREFKRITGWRSDKVLYFGDHVHTDLVDASAVHGWRTGAVIPELAREIELQSQPGYMQALIWHQYLQTYIHRAQMLAGEDATQEEESILENWKYERTNIQHEMKIDFNAQFGSFMRTLQNPSHLANAMLTYADIYTSSLDNLNAYSPRHHFVPQRIFLPHEARVQVSGGQACLLGSVPSCFVSAIPSGQQQPSSYPEAP
eukprot:comp16053_c1_seq1/m.13546 comp16053_c1_seq1/g.13546  ORF comp16053_c1_seq1/g.13546 comp16053_c1_seq1/m.13546 type:complete len:550 (-) comp16053_c1_seq1:17-1666(-)